MRMKINWVQISKSYFTSSNSHPSRPSFNLISTTSHSTTTTPQSPSTYVRSKTSINKSPTDLNPKTTSSTRKQLPIYLRYANNPSELNIRVQQLCQRPDGGLNAAIELVKSSSVQVATVSVWTQLLQHIIDAKRFSFVYKLFLEMKRRAIQPDPRFFISFFAALAKCPPSRNITLPRLQCLWSDAEPLRSIPVTRTALTNAYLHCLTSHGHGEEAFDVFESLSPNTIDSVTISQMLKPLTESQSVSDRERARSLWDRLGTTLDLDVRAIMSFASLFLRSPQRVDQDLASQILESKLGLSLGPNYRYWASADKSGPLGRKIRFDAGSLSSLLRMLLGMRKYSVICRLWAQIVANRDLYLERQALDFLHCGLAMVAMGKCDAGADVEDLLVWMLKSENKRLRPRCDTLDKALQASWESNNLTVSLRILVAFTKVPHDGILTSTEASASLLLQAAEPCSLRPSTRALCTVLQTAQGVGTTPALERALRAIHRIGCALLRTESEARQECEAERKEIRVASGSSVPPFDLSFERYWRRQYVWVLSDILDRVMKRVKVSEDQTEWKAWRDRIDDFLAKNGDVEFRNRIETRRMLVVDPDGLDRPQSRIRKISRPPTPQKVQREMR